MILEFQYFEKLKLFQWHYQFLQLLEHELRQYSMNPMNERISVRCLIWKN